MLGGVVVARAPLNSQLGRAVGGLQASVVALAISFLAILALSALIGGLGGLRRIGDAPLHVVIGDAGRRGVRRQHRLDRARSLPAG